MIDYSQLWTDAIINVATTTTVGTTSADCDGMGMLMDILEVVLYIFWIIALFAPCFLSPGSLNAPCKEIFQISKKKAEKV